MTTDYTAESYALARHLTLAYSSSFGLASRLFGRGVCKHIYAVYGMVRVADEIVDTYAGTDAAELLDAFERDTAAALATGYSTNPILQAFAATARLFAIDSRVIAPFFASMRMDLAPIAYDRAVYEKYIYGSAEVVGLMCLAVFTGGDGAAYERLAPAARALGSAYQKVNFLRDIRADHDERGRTYFPGVSYDALDDTMKAAIVADIRADFTAARDGIDDLPASSRRAVAVSYAYYSRLLDRLAAAPISRIKEERIRIPGAMKLAILAFGAAKGRP